MEVIFATISRKEICDAIHHIDLLRWLAGRNAVEAVMPVEVLGMVQDDVRPGCHRHNAVVRFDTLCEAIRRGHRGAL